jgi:hypothetical protein
MSDEGRRSTLASIAGGGRPHGDLQVLASRLIEGHDKPLPSIKPDTIDNLAHAIACNLILLVRSFRMEVERGLVYPRQIMLDDLQIDTSSYAMVQKLKETSDDTTLTMRDAVTRSVQWRWTSIDVDPSAAALASTTPS